MSEHGIMGNFLRHSQRILRRPRVKLLSSFNGANKRQKRFPSVTWSERAALVLVSLRWGGSFRINAFVLNGVKLLNQRGGSLMERAAALPHCLSTACLCDRVGVEGCPCRGGVHAANQPAAENSQIVISGPFNPSYFQFLVVVHQQQQFSLFIFV